MNILIAITTCHRYADRAEAVRSTWAKEVEGAEIKFFLGMPTQPREPLPDEIFLDVPDGYHFLTQKTQLIRRWARANRYDWLWKVDDDVYLRPERLKELDLTGIDYGARHR